MTFPPMTVAKVSYRERALYSRHRLRNVEFEKPHHVSYLDWGEVFRAGPGYQAVSNARMFRPARLNSASSVPMNSSRSVIHRDQPPNYFLKLAGVNLRPAYRG
jgi:hypothetical protein